MEAETVGYGSVFLSSLLAVAVVSPMLGLAYVVGVHVERVRWLMSARRDRLRDVGDGEKYAVIVVDVIDTAVHCPFYARILDRERGLDVKRQ